MSRSLLLILVLGLSTITQAFVPIGPSSRASGATTTTSGVVLKASSVETAQELFKAGLLANLETEAAALAAKKVKSVKDLGWTKPAKRRGNSRPRHWAWGGSAEKAAQDKPNYDPSSPQCVETWLSVADFYKIVKDDTAIADTIFVALAGGGAHIEREVAEGVIESWRGPTGKMDEAAFNKSVQQGRQGFIAGWAAFIGITSFSIIGIAWPTNPLQLALVDLLESTMHNDATIAEKLGGSM
jgi:hypothetical protein